MTARVVVNLKYRDRDATERMDDPDCDLEMLYRTYAQFKVVNRIVAGWHHTYRRYVRPLLHQNKSNTLLDIGAGGADVTRAIAHWARRDGLALHITAADPDQRAYSWAMHHIHGHGMQYAGLELGTCGQGGDLRCGHFQPPGPSSQRRGTTRLIR